LAYPNAHLFVDGPVIHHFEQPGWRASRPSSKDMQEHPYDSCASQAPLDAFRLATGGTPGYLVQDAVDADQFYAESTPTWWIPGRYYDLRNAWTTFYLKEIAPISVAPGFQPRLFVAAYMPKGTLPRVRGSGWFLKEPLTVSRGEWAYNEIFLTTDRARWDQLLHAGSRAGHPR